MISLALVVPCKNEYSRLQPAAFLQAVADYPFLTLLFVDDGSTDKTAETIAFLANKSPAIQALYLPENVGKAEAVRTGVNWLLAHTEVDAVGFWDADLATPLSELPEFLRALDKNPSRLAVLGARWAHLGAKIRRTGFRNWTGTVMKHLINRILGQSVYDTQCGAKIFRRELAREIFRRPLFSRWLFDVELLKRIGSMRLRHAVVEIPLEAWRDVPGSKIRLTDSFRMFRDLFVLARINYSSSSV